MNKLLSFTIILLFAIKGYTQGINFQGVARSANGTIIASSNVGLRLSIISKNVDATPEFIETKTVMTNAQGIFSIVVGDGSNTTVVGNFKNIIWSENPKFLKVEMDPAGGTNYLNMGATQLQYVPYSFYSYGVDAVNVKGIVPVKAGGTGVATLEELKTALNITSNNSIDTSSLSNRIDSKLNKIDTANLSSRINSINSILSEDDLYNIKLGKNITTNVPAGYWNISIGGSNLLNNTTGDRNVAIGAYALSSNVTGRYNIGIGSDALATNISGWNNNAIGLKSLGSNKTGTSNTAFGFYSLTNHTSGNENTAIGYNSGASVTNGSGNVLLGSNAGNNNAFSNINSKLIIANSNTINPLIYGDFSNKKLKFNADIDSLSILNRINFVDENANDHINKYDTGYNSPLIYSRYFYGHYGDLIIQGMSKTYTGNIHFVTGSNMPGYESPRQRMVIMDNGNVGVGDFVNSAPTSKLQVSGIVSASGYKIPGGTSAQYLRADGTVATSVTSGVPYAGASQAVDLGAFNMKVNGVTIGIGATTLTSTSTNTAVGNSSLLLNTTGIFNTAVGYSSLFQNTTGSYNIAIGTATLNVNSTGSYNTAIGGFSMNLNTTGLANTAIGSSSLQANKTGTRNTAVGNQALQSNWGNSGSVAIGYNSMFNADNRAVGRYTGNTAIGYESLKGSNTPANNIGVNNTAIGYQTLMNNTSGYENTALGSSSLFSNTVGTNNTAIGLDALKMNTIGINNTSGGSFSLLENISGNYNTAFGLNAMRLNISGYSNTSIGNGALYTNTEGHSNTAIGYQSLFGNTTGIFNTAIGYEAGSSSQTFTNSTSIGYNAQVTASNQIQLGNSSITDVKTSGSITAAGFKVVGGTASQTLMADGSTSSNLFHYIGESYAGGIIFYISDNGLHGLVASLTDQSTSIRWNGGSNVNTGARSFGINGGMRNTTLIIASQISIDGNPFAASICNEFYTMTAPGSGFTIGDWYLPSADELNLLFLKKDIVGGFSNDYYWCSTEIDSSMALVTNFGDTNPNGATRGKQYTARVRAIRSF